MSNLGDDFCYLLKLSLFFFNQNQGPTTLDIGIFSAVFVEAHSCKRKTFPC